jgi:chromosome partitioning protein
MNQKGGVGKTTTTVNLGAAMARLGRRVLVVDLDPQAHATLHLGVLPEGGPTVYDLLIEPAGAALACAHPVSDNLFLVPSVTDLAAVESELADEGDRRLRLRAVLDSLVGAAEVAGRPFDAVLIDCPPSLGLLTVNGLCAAREVFIPMQAHFLALQGVGKLLETVRALSTTANPRLRVTGIVLCMHDPNTTHTREVVTDLEGFFEQARAQDPPPPWRSARVYRPAIRRNIKLAECPSFGQTIFEYAPACPGAADYLELARTIVAEWDRFLARRAEGAATAESAPAAPAEGAPAPAVVTIPSASQAEHPA